MMLNSKLFFPLVLFYLLFTACADKDIRTTNPPSDQRGHLVSFIKQGGMTANEIVSINEDEGDISSLVKHDVDIYSIVYNSLYDGNPLEVSGLVLIPQNISSELDLVQNHHGTIIPFYGEGETPSLYTGGLSESSEMHFVGATMASNGYAVSMPDYVGYGITRDKEHPYTIHHELAEVSVDMIRASKQLLSQLGLSFSNDLFLTGWSEGGGAALATHKYLQEIYPGEFNVKASSLLAGPYDYFEFLKDVFTNSEIEDEELSIYSWSAYALNKYDSSLNRDPNTIWTYQVANQMDALDVPSNRPSDILQATFMQGFLDESDLDLILAARRNTLIEGWLPQGQLFFHSGTDDLIVPHYNSTNAHEYCQSIGVNSTLYEYPGGDHYTPLYNYVTTTLNDFNAL